MGNKQSSKRKLDYNIVNNDDRAPFCTFCKYSFPSKKSLKKHNILCRKKFPTPPTNHNFYPLPSWSRKERSRIKHDYNKTQYHLFEYIQNNSTREPIEEEKERL